MKGTEVIGQALVLVDIDNELGYTDGYAGLYVIGTIKGSKVSKDITRKRIGYIKVIPSIRSSMGFLPVDLPQVLEC